MIQLGAANKVINNELGTDIQAAKHQQKVRYIRDDLEANALWIETDQQKALFISCDLVGLSIAWNQKLVSALAAACNIPAESVVISCTHTHSGPAILGPTSPDKPIDEAYLARLHDWLITLAKQAIASATAGQLAWGVGRAPIGYNRRICWPDGVHTMYTRGRDIKNATGLEGPDDHQHVAIFARDTAGTLKAILYNNSTHPIAFYGADFLSADFAGLTRQYLRELFGNIPVLFVNGSIGDITPQNLLASQPYNET